MITNHNEHHLSCYQHNKRHHWHAEFIQEFTFVQTCSRIDNTDAQKTQANEGRPQDIIMPSL